MKKSLFPSWLHRKLPSGCEGIKTSSILQKHQLFSVCEEAKCPNASYCFAKKCATFLILGNICTRHCSFCNIAYSPHPLAPDPQEIVNIAKAVKELQLTHVVITMVTRDDLIDGGALHLNKILHNIRSIASNTTIEILTSDFAGKVRSLKIALAAQPDIFNHNIETTREMTQKLRHKAQYDRSLFILEKAKAYNKSKFIKSGLMVGLGETVQQVKKTITDLYNVGCDIITIGQYLQPNHKKRYVKNFISPKIFQEYEEFGKKLGIPFMLCGPFVRSSLQVDQIIQKLH